MDLRTATRQPDLLTRLFAVLTAKLEDGAALAVDGQAPDLPDSDYLALAGRLAGIGQEVLTIAEAIEALTMRDDQPTS